MNNLEDCLKKNLVKKSEDAKQWIEKESNLAKRYLDSAKKVLEIKENGVAVLSAYNAILHTSRMLLYSKGYLSKNHTCVIIAAEELYAQNKEIIGYLNAVKNILALRNAIQYYGRDADEELSDYVVGIAEDYLECAKKELKL
jgi:uncharacterized protein (UPF0332 family)